MEKGAQTLGGLPPGASDWLGAAEGDESGERDRYTHCSIHIILRCGSRIHTIFFGGVYFGFV